MGDSYQDIVKNTAARKIVEMREEQVVELLLFMEEMDSDALAERNRKGARLCTKTDAGTDG